MPPTLPASSMFVCGVCETGTSYLQAIGEGWATWHGASEESGPSLP